MFISEAEVLILTVCTHTSYDKTRARFSFWCEVPGTKWGHVTHVLALKKKLIRVDNDIENYSGNCHHLFFV